MQTTTCKRAACGLAVSPYQRAKPIYLPSNATDASRGRPPAFFETLARPSTLRASRLRGSLELTVASTLQTVVLNPSLLDFSRRLFASLSASSFPRLIALLDIISINYKYKISQESNKMAQTISEATWLVGGWWKYLCLNIFNGYPTKS